MRTGHPAASGRRTSQKLPFEKWKHLGFEKSEALTATHLGQTRAVELGSKPSLPATKRLAEGQTPEGRDKEADGLLLIFLMHGSGTKHGRALAMVRYLSNV